jgi:hypothetical protein
MPIQRQTLLILLFVFVGLIFLTYLSTFGGNWSAASAQTTPPTLTPTPTRPPIAEVPEADTLILVGGGLGGLATWLGWQRQRIKSRRP